MRLFKSFPSALLLLGLIAAPLLAHHNVTKEFDQTKAVTIQGVVTKVEWMNPHAWITLKAKGTNGVAITWHVEIAAATVLLRTIGIRPEDLALGQSCSMEIWPARDGSKTAYGRKLTLADGKSFDIHERFSDPVPLSVPAK
jgi:hypothetical protein